MASEFSADDLERYSRHLLLDEVGIEGQRRLRDGSVLCVGAGGLGSPALLYLAAAGVGRIGIIDFDRVDRSNLQRQVVHDDAAVGTAKVDSARARLLALNPSIHVEVFDGRLSAANAVERVSGFDVVVDGSDNFATRYLVNDACVLAGKPLVYGSIFKFEGQVSVFNFRGGPDYRDLYPEPPPLGAVPSCGEAGVLGVLPGVIGVMQATEAMKILLGIGTTLSGRLLLYDALSMRFREMTLTRDASRAPVEHLVDADPACAASDTRGVTPVELARRREAGWAPYLLDVRRASEAAIVQIAGTDAQIAHDAIDTAVDTLPRDRDIVVYCKRGGRSAAACAALHGAGFRSVWNLEGGIEAWIAEVEPHLPRY